MVHALWGELVTLQLPGEERVEPVRERPRRRRHEHERPQLGQVLLERLPEAVLRVVAAAPAVLLPPAIPDRAERGAAWLVREPFRDQVCAPLLVARILERLRLRPVVWAPLLAPAARRSDIAPACDQDLPPAPLV